MKTASTLSKAEMKKVTGGVISKETWMDMCLQGKFLDVPISYDGSLNDEIRQAINESICEDAYDNMPD